MSQQNNPQQKNNESAKTSEPKAVERFTIHPDGSILLIKPRLELQGDLHQNRADSRTLTRIWEPNEALIVGSVLIIEEWAVILPLTYVHVGRWLPLVDKGVAS